MNSQQSRTSERPRLNDQEIARRLWRIYEMALQAAERSDKQATTEDNEKATR